MRFWRPPLYQLELLAYACLEPNLLASFLVQRMLVAPLAVLLQLDTIRIVLLVLLGRVVTALAHRARQSDQRTHEFSFMPQLKRAWISYT